MSFLNSVLDGFRQFLKNVWSMFFNVLFTIGLPFAVWIVGEVVTGIKYPHGESPLSGVGVVGAIATFGLWCTWHERSLKVNIFAAVFRVLLCYLFVFMPTFWLIPSSIALGAGIYAALFYYLIGYCALNVWQPTFFGPATRPTRGANVEPGHHQDQGSTRSQATDHLPSPADSKTSSYEEMKKRALDQLSKGNKGGNG